MELKNRESSSSPSRTVPCFYRKNYVAKEKIQRQSIGKDDRKPAAGMRRGSSGFKKNKKGLMASVKGL